MASMSQYVQLSRIHGGRKLAQVAMGRELNRLFSGALRSRLMPSLHELDQVAGKTYRNAAGVMAHLGGEPSVADEAREVVERAKDWGARHAKFPENWGVEHETAQFLYNFVRAARPNKVLETGVANGTSSFVILSALHANGHGTLVSTDIEASIHGDMPQMLADRWTYVHLRDRIPEREMPLAFAANGPYDVYFHDADHSYLGQGFEYHTAWANLVDGGWFLSDDIDFSTAWIEFAIEKNLQTIHLVDGRKVLGIARKGASLSFDGPPGTRA
jgi:predicted O-methyltransferase YrrM